MDNKKIANELNDLLTKNYDAEKGYKEAADVSDHSQLKSFFQEQAKNRYNFGHKLKEEIREYGQEPDKGTSTKGDLHRAWLNLRDSLSSGNEALYEECIRGEKTAVEEYEEFLEKDGILDSTKTIIRDQKQSIETALTKLEQMEDFAS